MFVLPLYVVLSVAFGTVDFENFGIAVPYYAPWWWSFSTFNQTLSQFYVGTHVYQAPLIRTFEYVFFASVICLVLGYAVAYYTARFATKYRGLILILLVSPFWISYLMRIYAWQGLLDTNGPINWLLSPVGFGQGVYRVEPSAAGRAVRAAAAKGPPDMLPAFLDRVRRRVGR